jgi:UDP-glucuronate decarboxylase
LTAVSASRPAAVYGDGLQTRSFCYVDDMVDGLIRLMRTSDHITGPLNLGNPEETTILRLAESIIAMTASKSRIVRQPLPHDDPRQRRPDIAKASKLMDWIPKVSLEDGLKETVAYFRKILAT